MPESKSRRWRPLLWPAVFALMALALATFALPYVAEAFQPDRHVRIFGVSASPLEFVTKKRTVADALAEAGITLAPDDKVEPARESALAEENDIRITPAVSVVLYSGGERRVVRSTAGRVDRLLKELGIQLHELDRVQPALDTPLSQGMQVRVVRVHEQTLTRTEPIAFETVHRDDPSLARGKTKLVRAGQPGVKEITIRRVYHDGKLLKEEAVGEQVLQPPVNAVVAVGTTAEVSRGGVTYRYRNSLTMKATAYAPGDGHTPGTRTFTGLPAKHGVVAVDPRVIPLGTRLYIEGYGPAIAADTGGAIKGNRIDLCFNSPAEAHRYGVRKVKVYVLVD